MKVYSLKNKKGKVSLVFAENPKEARQILFDSGHIFDIANVKSTEDTTQTYLTNPTYGAATVRALAKNVKGYATINSETVEWNIKPI